LKGCKEFLLALGSCWYPDGSHNGFFVQRFGLDTLPAFSGKPHTTHLAHHIQSPSRPVSRDETLESTSPSHASNTRISSNSEKQSPPTSPGQITWISQKSPSENWIDVLQPSSAPNAPFIFVEQSNDDTHSNSSGRSRRKGALNAASLINLREIRKIGACWNCWAMKVPVSPLPWLD
jgi:hypothetical protein